MSEFEQKDTQPTPVTGGTQPTPVVPSERKNFPRWLPVLVIVLLLACSVIAGYGSGIGQRTSTEKTQVTGQLQEQFQLGQEAMKAGNYVIARQHFEFIIQNNPDFPGVQAAYTDLLLRMQTSPTPTLTPSPTVTPTADLRNAEEIFNHAQSLLNAGDWNGTIGDLDSLRKTAPDYRTAEVDGMYYVVLRQRGVSKIAAQRCADINLEGGIFDLSLAERFAPLDKTALSLRTYARLYIIGSSYWDQNWPEVKYYFGQVMAALPQLSDSSCMSATERWRVASIKYAEQLMAGGDTCGASIQFDEAVAMGSPANAAFFPTATVVNQLCNGENVGGGEPAPPAAAPPVETATPCPTGAASLLPECPGP